MTDMKEQKALRERPSERSMMTRPFDEIERLYESIFPRGWFRQFASDWPARDRSSLFFAHRTPALDVIDRESEIVVRAEVPGVRKEDIKLVVSDHTLSLGGTTEKEEEEKRDDYYRHEMNYGEFSRTINLPAEVDASNVKAILKAGVLEVRLPKIEQAKAQSIDVQVE